MDKKEIANLLEIELRTLYNWEKSRQKLYNFIMTNIEDNPKFNELKTYFEKLMEVVNPVTLQDLNAIAKDFNGTIVFSGNGKIIVKW